MYTEDRKSFRKETFSKIEEQFQRGRPPEDDLFYRHPSEDKIVLSHALFWVMTRNLKGKVTKDRFFLLLRQLEEEMLEAYLTESEDFKELLHYCNILYNILPMMLRSDMPEALAYDLLDDIDFYYNKVKCRKIEQLLPSLTKLVIEEQKDI